MVYNNLIIESFIKEYYGKDSSEYKKLVYDIKNNNYNFDIDQINSYLEAINEYPKLSSKEQIECIQKIINGNSEAREILIKSNLYYVALIAIKYIGNGLTFDDLIQEGTLALIHIIDNLDEKKNKGQNKF